MGYSTAFEGAFRLDRPLTPEHKAILEQLAEDEHVPGEDGKPRRAADSGRPCVYCQWRPTHDGTEIMYDGVEKFYCWLEWLNYIIQQKLKPWGYVLSGKVKWQGEEMDDAGVIYVKDNRIEADYNVNPGPSWDK